MTRQLYTHILIAGGSGFIGSNFIRFLYHTRPAYRLWNLDVLTYAGNPENLRDIETHDAHGNRYHFVKGDICDEALLEKLFSAHQFDAVINFAAESHVDRSIVHAADFIRTNIEGVRTLMEASRTHHVKRFIQISTDEIYGSVPEGATDERALIQPSNPYSASKAGADLLVQSYINTHRVPAVIVRGSNNYGPYQYPEKLIPLALTNLFEGTQIPIHGTGEHIRSWLHVEDFCAAIDLIMHKAPDFSIYNISGEEKTNIEIITALADNLNINIAAAKAHVGDRPGADVRYAPDSTKVKRELGWKPAHTFIESIPHIISWYKNNEAWWRDIKQKKEFRDHYKKQSKAQYY